MQEIDELLSEDDLALIHALQLRPRASWTELGAALGVDPVTAARRWQRLNGRGAAWVGTSPGPRLLDLICGAYLDIACEAWQAAAVAAELARHPHMLTLERVAGEHHIWATVGAADLAAMSRYTLDILPAVAHVTDVRAHLITHMFTEGGDWRIDALAPDQRTLLRTPPARPPAARDRARVTDLDRDLLTALAPDGRTSYADLAAALGAGAAAVKRRMEELTRLGLLRFRCDFARPPARRLAGRGHLPGHRARRRRRAHRARPGRPAADPQLRGGERPAQPRSAGQPAFGRRCAALRIRAHRSASRTRDRRTCCDTAARQTPRPPPRCAGPLDRTGGPGRVERAGPTSIANSASCSHRRSTAAAWPCTNP
ncbi:AsnC family protein [Nocardia crassostreae]|uniref:Lrp/AsnC family transcriptional regulator n=1 Tax=Nocardia crassostreae TaxID=53428 RepID=UPI001C3F9F1B